MSDRKYIWTYWDDANLPSLVRTSIQSWKRCAPNYTIMLINQNTISQFIDISTYPKLGNAAISDILRLTVLSKYGGLWMDATIIMHRPIDQIITDPDKVFVFKERNRVYPESWMLYYPKEGDVSLELWRKELHGILKIWPQVDCHHCYQKVKLAHKRKTYFMIYQSWYYLYQTNESFRYVFDHEWVILDAQGAIYGRLHFLRWKPNNQWVTKFTSGGRRLHRIEQAWRIRETEILILVFLLAVCVICICRKNKYT